MSSNIVSKLRLFGLVSWFIILGILLLFTMYVSSLYDPVNLGEPFLFSDWPNYLFPSVRKEHRIPSDTLFVLLPFPSRTLSSESILRSASPTLTRLASQKKNQIDCGIKNQHKYCVIWNKNGTTTNNTNDVNGINVTDSGIYSELDCEKGMPDSDALWQRLVIVTAFSENHAREGMWMIASAQKQMPNKRIIVYDLGVRKKTLLKLSKLCDVEIRKFDFTKYPKHVTWLHNFAWKVIIIKETLFEFGAIFYGDYSVRFQTSLRELFPYLHLHHGYMFHILSYDAKHPGGAVKPLLKMTNRAMYRQLGVDLQDYMYNKFYNVTPHISAGRVMLVNNSIVNEKVISPLLNCVLHKQCVHPEGATRMNHHFDQAATSIILYKNMRGEWTYQNRENSTDQFDKVIQIKRTGRKQIPNGYLCTNVGESEFLDLT